ncbi:MAG: alpha-glucosidase [Oscillospiraceae bacterium]|jgi:alpha-glucosidase|nr:alpha-glucosidase [Oscillospiraceae bacterium]
MIRRYSFGHPFQTDAVVKSLPPIHEPVPYFTVENDGCTLACPLSSDTIVYGLGETVRGINKRGWHYCSSCSDEPQHTEGKQSLYASDNFLLLVGKEQMFGVFLDYPGKVDYDIGYTNMNHMAVTVGNADYDLYIIDGKSAEDIVHQFRGLIGRSYIAPKWAFGYGQSRWSYYSEDEVREVVQKHRENHVPLDMVYLDIDYMDHYKDFTLNDKAFPDFADFVQEMRRQNIHLVPIIDAGVKQEKGYDVCDEGLENDYFCKKADGTPFVGAVWPGKAYFPDFLNPEVRAWFGGKYRFLLDKGVDGFWNDMNEPALFYSEDGLKSAFAEMKKLEGQNLDMDKVNYFRGLVTGLSNNPKDYESFYHNCGGERVRHDKIHNLYGYEMTRSAGEAFEKYCPDKRVLMFSRSSMVGMHRYGGVWTGDNCSWWSHLLLEIQMMPSLSMCGFLYSGADIGGFGDNTTADLLLRWIAFGVFTPLMRNHSALGTRCQEVYRFPEALPVFRNLISIRYALLPYLYSEYMKAALQDTMYFKPLAFVYPQDKDAARVQDQLMLGDELMVTPVYTQNAVGRTVYLPEPMKLVRMHSAQEIWTEQMGKGYHYISIALDEVVFFLRSDRMIPLAMGGESVPEVDFGDLTLLTNVQHCATYQYYSDDGCSKDYDNPKNRTCITMKADGTVSTEGQLPVKLNVKR